MALMSEKELAVLIAVPDEVMHVELADKESFQEAVVVPAI